MIDSTIPVAQAVVREDRPYEEVFQFSYNNQQYVYNKGDACPLEVIEKLLARKWVVSRISNSTMPTAPFDFCGDAHGMLRFSVVKGKGVIKNKAGKKVYWDFPLGEAASNVKNGHWCVTPKRLLTVKSLKSLCNKIPGLVVFKESKQVPFLKFREFPAVKAEGSLVRVLWKLSDEIV